MNDAIPPELEPKALARKLLDQGLGGLFKDEKIREACCTSLEQAGVRPPVNHVVVFALGGVLGFTVGLLGEKAVSVLASLVETTPGVRRVFTTVLKVCSACEDKTQLHTQLLAALRGQAGPIRMDVNAATPLEVATALRAEQQAERLSEEIRKSTADVVGAFAAWFEALQAPKLLDPSDASAPVGSVTASLKYTAERDPFVGREDDLDFLHRLIGDETLTMSRRPVLWQLMIGPGGLGKSRLGLQFMRQAQALGWEAGFIRDVELRRLDPARWRPTRPTVLIIDYPAREPDLISEKLDTLACHADEYLFPLRIVLLERRAEGEWFTKLIPPLSEGDRIRKIQFQPPRELSPLSRSELLSLMHGRLPDSGAGWTGDDLLAALRNVDPRTVDTDTGKLWAPRPLFAVATAEVLASGDDHGPLTRTEVLDHILDREEFLWTRQALDPKDLSPHRTLLALSTMTLGLDRATLEQDGRLRDDLPSFRGNDGRVAFDPDLFRHMSGSAPGAQLGALEPDLLGEWFVVRFLLAAPTVRPRLVETALALGEFDAAAFVVRTVSDFPRSEALQLLQPSSSAGDNARKTFAGASIDLMGHAGDGLEAAHHLHLWRWLSDAAQSTKLDAANTNMARAAFNYALRRGKAGDLHGERETFEWLKAFADTHDQPAIRAEAAKVAFNYTLHQGRAGDLHGERETFEWLKAFAGTHDQPEIKTQAAKAAFSYALDQGNAGDLDSERETFEWLKAFADTHDQAEIRVQAAKTGFNYAVHQGRAGDLRGERETFEWLKAFADTHDQPEIKTQAAKAAFSYALDQGNAGDLDSERETFEWLKAFSDAHDQPEIRAEAARAAFNYALDQGNAGDLHGERETFEWLKDFADTHDQPEIRAEAAEVASDYALQQGRAGDLSGERETFEWLKAFADAHDQPGLRTEAAKAAFSYALDQRNVGDLDGQRETFEWLKAFADTHDQPEIRAEAAKTAFSYALGQGDAGDLDGQRETFEWLKAFADTHDQPEIRTEAAGAAFNYALDQSRAGDLDGMLKTFEWLKAFADAHGQPEIRTDAARTAFNYLLECRTTNNLSEATAAASYIRNIAAAHPGEPDLADVVTHVDRLDPPEP